MNLNINRERLGLLRDIADGLVEDRRTVHGTETIRRDRTHRHGPLARSNWRWRRCGPAVRELVAADLVAELGQIGADDPGPWPRELTGEGRSVLDQHTAPVGGRP